MHVTTKNGVGKITSPSDRRKYKRVLLSFRIQVSGIDCTGHEFQERTVISDVSEYGCRFDLLRQILLDDVVKIEVVRLDGGLLDEREQLQFKVAWVDPSVRGWTIGASKLRFLVARHPATFPAVLKSKGHGRQESRSGVPEYPVIGGTVTARCHCGVEIRTASVWLEQLKTDVIPETIRALRSG